jgi:hypothetical protein
MMEEHPYTFNSLEWIKRAFNESYPEKLPAWIGLNAINYQYLIPTTPKALQQIYVDKNKFHTKHWFDRMRFKDFIK